MKNQEKKFEILDHPADVKLKAYGENKRDLFQSALLGMMAVLAPSKISDQSITRTISIQAIDRAALLVNFLSEALYFAQTEKETYQNTSFLELTQAHAVALLKGKKVNRFEREIKGISYQGVEIKKRGESYEVTIIFDV